MPISWHSALGAFCTEQQQKKSWEPSLYLRFVKCALKGAYRAGIVCVSKYT